MMQSVAVRLTLFYLAMIMVLSLGFSMVIYRISSHELERSSPPDRIFLQFGGDPGARQDFEAFRQAQLQAGENNVRNNLILLNVSTLVLGAIVSYGLARRTLKPIEEAFEAQGRFTADASHELRTPLTAMQTTIEVGLRNPKLTLPVAKTLLSETLDEVKKLGSLSNGLLKLTRNNGQDMPRQPVLLKKVVADAMSQLELAAKNRQVSITSDVADLTVLGDDISLKEVLVILIDNAIKYSKEATTITITGRQQGKYALLSVTDRGVGMKATDLQYIFDRFYRADASRSRDRIEGYGLGLSIAQKIIEAHHGAIEAKSKLGEGSTFTVKIPLAA